MLEISVNILNITIDITACIFDLDTANGKKIIIKILAIEILEKILEEKNTFK